MRYVFMVALATMLTATLSMPATATDASAPSLASTNSAKKMLPPPLPCIPGLGSSPVCADNLQAYLAPNEAGAPSPWRLWDLVTESSRASLSKRFDAGFRSRRQRQADCLKNEPPRPPQAYRYAQRAAWAQSMSMNSKRPFFYASQQESLIKQRSYSDYLYCVTHGGF